MTEEIVRVRAIQTQQRAGTDVFAFFVPGDVVSRVADISRISRTQDGLTGFQRGAIRSHVSEIASFLESGDVLFPNAIVLALTPGIRFEQSRGPSNSDDTVRSGWLHLPVRPEGRRAAWIVDGQQRALALEKAKQGALLVPVVAFTSDDINVQREQFILVNKARPLPSRLIDELLPEVDVTLPRDLSMRRIPSALCDLLDRDPASPFCGLIRRESRADNSCAVVADTALIQAIRDSFRMGHALAVYPSEEGLEAPYLALRTYWQAVKDCFPEAWGLPPQQSRLMHSIGIRVMGGLMDQIWIRAESASDPYQAALAALKRIAPFCRWTEGTWPEVGWEWNDVQQTQKHLRGLKEYLFRRERELARQVS